jgi:hypothetical protein
MRINSRALQSLMDTDYGLPVPMHRPFITLDDQYDEPLPFRCRLKQVTELTAENSSQYTLPKKRCPSRLEKLPSEIRRKIYEYLHIPPIYTDRKFKRGWGPEVHFPEHDKAFDFLTSRSTPTNLG